MMRGAHWIAPWRGTHRASAIVSVLIPLLCVAGTVITAIWGSGDKPVSATVLAIGLAFSSAFVLAPGALLARDASRMRVPAVARSMALSLGLSILVVTALTALVWGVAGTGAADATMSVLAGMLLGVVWALLPRRIGLVFCFLPVFVSTGLWQRLLPDMVMLHPRTSADIGVLVLVAVAAVLWTGFVNDRPYLNRFGDPLVEHLGSHRRGWTRHVDKTSQQRRLRSTSAAWRARPDLSGSGPEAAERSLRVALGGAYLPMRPIQRCKQWLLGVGVSVLLLALVVFNGAVQNAHLRHLVLLQLGIVCLAWFGALLPVIGVLVMLGALHARWNRINAERPLLALLPGLAQGPGLKRHLLLAALRGPLLALAVFGAIVLGLELDLGRLSPPPFYVMLALLGSALALVSGTLAIFGHARPGTLRLSALSMLGTILVSLGSFLPMSFGAWSTSTVQLIQGALAAGWLGFALGMIDLGRHGWRGYRQLPHPFVSD